MIGGLVNTMLLALLVKLPQFLEVEIEAEAGFQFGNNVINDIDDILRS